MKKLLVPLNGTIVVCTGNDTPHAVQISCKAERPDDIETISTYYLVQYELTDLIIRLVEAHIEAPVPSSLVFEGERYVLLATAHAPWDFGKRVGFFWGHERLEACKDKWTFHFQAKRHAKERQIGSLSEEIGGYKTTSLIR
ncbi:hypothetical protein BV20DRAFT_546318 [Pilatotrama ljubarskyi]|nr:hypothetical protein BV20DRAFT_546318 [Pilatotrama ljubarskyi]